MQTADSSPASERTHEAYSDSDGLGMPGLFAALRHHAVRIVALSVFAMAVVGGALLFVPKTYESSASLLVEQRDNSFIGASGQVAGPIGMDALLSSQIELIKSRDLLLEVARSQGLDKVPEFATPAASPIGLLLSAIGRPPAASGVEETILINLADRMTVIRERDSAVISIFVRSADADLAARLANAIAQAHVKRRAQQSANDAAEATVWLQQEIDRLRLKVQQTDTAVANFKVQNNLFVGTNATPVADQQLSTVIQQISDAQQRRSTAEARAASIRQMLAQGQSLDSISDVRDAPSYQRLLDTRGSLTADLAQKSTTLLPAHPTIKALKAQIREVNAQLLDEGRKVADSLEAEASVEASLVAKLTEDLRSAKTTAGDATKGSVTLDSLEREAKAQRDLLESYLAKYSDAVSRSADNAVLPDVRVVSEAAPSTEPASPKVTFIVAIVGFVTAALQVGGVVFGELLATRSVLREDEAMDEPEIAPSDTMAATPATASIAVPQLRRSEPGEARAETPAPASSGTADVSELGAAIVNGEFGCLLFVGLDDGADRAAAIGALADRAIEAGLSVATVEAGLARDAGAPGISDLSLDLADYGDVVQQLDPRLAIVPWGRASRIDPRSPKPATLVEALADIYEVVLIDAGVAGLASALPIFSGVEGRVVVIAASGADPVALARARRDIARIGFDTTGVLVSDSDLPAVA